MDAVCQLMKNLKVLYVEDEEVSRIILKKMLRKMVQKVYIAENGEKGLNLFNEVEPDIVITDLRMPVINGIELIKEIRKIDKTCGIIVMTEVSDVNYILESIDIGIDKYLVKPIDEKNINDALNIVIRKMIPRKFDDRQFSWEYGLNKEEKKLIEEKLKTKTSAFLKELTGKGPKYIKVFIDGNIIKINIHEGLTFIEKSLLENSKNRTLVEYNRTLLYENKKEELNTIISEIIEIEGTIKEIDIDILNNKDTISFLVNL